MRRFIALFVIVTLLLLGGLWSFRRDAGSPGSSNLSVVFVGFTNNPQGAMQPVRIEVVEGAAGMCALFRVANVGTNRPLDFKTLSIESTNRRGWVPFVPKTAWNGIEGAHWEPGYGCFYAVGWPPGLPTNATWRLRLSVTREPSGVRRLVNRMLNREVFGPSGRQTMLSSEVSK
jgi:hypothetical protein